MWTFAANDPPLHGACSIGLLVPSNVFLTLAWCGHLKFREWHWARQLGLFSVILLSWGIAYFEYCLQVPANRPGHVDRGGPYSLVPLKVMQEVVTLVVFTVFSVVAFRNGPLRWNHALPGSFLVAAVWLVFLK